MAGNSLSAGKLGNIEPDNARRRGLTLVGRIYTRGWTVSTRDGTRGRSREAEQCTRHPPELHVGEASVALFDVFVGIRRDQEQICGRLLFS